MRVPKLSRTARVLRTLTTLHLVALWAVVSIGCAGSAPAPEIGSERPAGIEPRLDTQAGEHVVVLTCPSPGYLPALTRVMDAHHHRNVFITVRRPNPAVSYTQQLVEQRVATGVPAAVPVWVYVRLIAWDAAKDDDASFGLLTQSTPPSTPAP